MFWKRGREEAQRLTEKRQRETAARYEQKAQSAIRAFRRDFGAGLELQANADGTIRFLFNGKWVDAEWFSSEAGDTLWWEIRHGESKVSILSWDLSIGALYLACQKVTARKPGIFRLLR